MDLTESEAGGGPSYDMKKCYDMLPTGLILRIVEERGASPRILRAERGFYAQLTRRFKLRGVLGDVWEHLAGEAEKATDIRSALELKLGKDETRALLAQAQVTVAKGSSGRKNR